MRAGISKKREGEGLSEKLMQMVHSKTIFCRLRFFLGGAIEALMWRLHEIF